MLECVDTFIVDGCCLVVQVTLGVEVHLLQYLFLSVYCVRCALLEYVALEMILVVRLPWSRTEITEVFTTYAGHEVTASASFDSLLAPWTELSVDGHPFGISFFLEHIFHPQLFLLTCARTVIVRLALKAKDFTACALDTPEIQVINLDAISAVNACTKLIVSVNG